MTATPDQTPGTPDPQPGRPRRWRGLLVNLLIVVAIFVGVHWYKARPLASGAAPPLLAPLTAVAMPAQDRAADTASVASGERIGTAPLFDLADWDGQPVLVHFWATWCPVCKLGEAGIDALRDDFNVITVAMQSGNADEINAYLREHDLGFATIADPYGEIASAWGVQGVPTTFVVGPDGSIDFAGVGYTAGLGLRARLWAARARE